MATSLLSHLTRAPETRGQGSFVLVAGLLAAASASASLIFACATPFAAFGALAAIVLPLRHAIAAVLVGAFAIFHGHAHGAELPPGTDAFAYSAGFVIATGLLHLAGIALGRLTRWPAGQVAVRTAGGLIACAGAFFLVYLA